MARGVVRGEAYRGASARFVVAIVCAALCLLATPRVWASSQDLFGVGARGIAMGNAVVSNVSGYAAVYYNPAALMRGDDNVFSLGYQRADFFTEVNGSDYPIDEASNLLIGLTIPIPFGGIMADRLALGFGFVLPTLSVLRANVPEPETPFFVLVENRPQIVGIHVGLALRIIDELLIGTSFLALSELHGGIDIAPNSQGRLGSVVRDELLADYAPIVGIYAEPWDWLSMGLVFHDESTADFIFPITADLGDSFPIEVPLLNVVGQAQYDPLQVSFEATLRPIEHLELAAGFSFKRFSTFQNPIENTTEPIPDQDPAGFDDTIVPRVGGEYVHILDEITLSYRLGGFLEPSPVLQQVANHNYLDNRRLALGMGVGLAWHGLTLDLAFQLQLMFERTHTKEPSLVRDPENAGLPSISHSGEIAVSVFELGIVF